MKKLYLHTVFISACFVLTLIPVTIRSQHTIKTYPVSFLFHRKMYLSYEYHPSTSLISFGLLTSSYLRTTINEYQGFDVSPFVKITMGEKKLPNAWYFEPRLIWGYLYANERYGYEGAAGMNFESFSIDFPIYGFGFLLGKQWVLKNGFTLGIDCGLKRVFRKIPESFEQSGKTYEANQPVFLFTTWQMGPGSIFDGHISIGYTFPFVKK